MRIIFTTKFRKSLKIRIVNNKSLYRKFEERARLFGINPNSPLLRNHKLTGNKTGLSSFSVTGDIRIVYKQKDENTAYFLDIGTHNQVY